jgi:hypothetical protein
MNKKIRSASYGIVDIEIKAHRSKYEEHRK